MNQRGLTLLEVFVILILIGVLSALLLPPICGPHHRTRCANNLSQLYKLTTVYSPQGKAPDATGEDFWLALTKTTPPLVASGHLEIFHCPLREDDWEPGRIDYRGPGKPWGKLGAGEPMGADKPGNHGDEDGGFVLMKDGSVLEAALKDSIWKQCAEKLRP